MLKRFLLGLFVALTLFPPSLVIAQGMVGQDSINQAKADLINRLINLINQLIDRIKELDAESPLVSRGVEKPTPPVIFEVIPPRGPVGTQLTVKGRGFLPQNNTVYTGYGPLRLPSPDGQTLTFTFSPPGAPADFPLINKAEFPGLVFGIYVVNENGQTAEPGKFIFMP